MAPNKDQLLAREQHARSMREAAREELADLERTHASAFDVVTARRALRLAEDELDAAQDAIWPPRRIA